MMTTQTSNRELHLDIETYCELDLSKTGVYAYASHPSFEILLVGYAYDDDEVTCVDMVNGTLPTQVIKDIFNPEIIKIAHNAAFEMTCFSEYFQQRANPKEWVCTMALAMHNGLPGSLEVLSSAMNLEKQKLSIGRALINYFSKPCKPTKANGCRTRNLPHHDKDKWQAFMKYCTRDVVSERDIYNQLIGLVQPDFEREVFLLDAEINKRGIMIDIDFVENAVAIDDKITAEHEDELRRITGLSNPNSTSQFKQYLQSVGYHYPSLTKKEAVKLYEEVEDPVIKRAVELKLLMSKTSTAKYKAMLNAVCPDGRVRGLYQYYGANRTGRWAGRLVQMQNLTKNKIAEVEFAKDLIRNGDMECLKLIYSDIPDILSQLIRPAFIAKEGCKFIVADYSAIEARVVAWLSQEQWRLDLFSKGGDIYCASASQMFKVPVEKHGVNSHLRQKGKISELALGYGGGVGALKSMGALEMGIAEEELPELVTAWRSANQKVVQMWRDFDRAAVDAIATGDVTKVPCGVEFRVVKGNMIMTLPSGRKLCYQKVRLEDDKFGKRIKFKGMNQVTRKWEDTDTYGAKLVENATQAIARDCLATAMLRLRDRGFEIVGHVHDEVIVEASEEENMKDVCDIMAMPLDWAKGLYLPAEAFESPYYKKD